MAFVSQYTKMRNWPLKTANTDRVRYQSGTDHYGDAVGIIAHDAMLQQQRMVKNALDVDVRPFYLFSRLHAGRRCCCFRGVNQEPKGDCPICSGVGVPGGYEKFGTHAEVVDPSRDCVCVNVVPEYADPSMPPHFELSEDANYGYVECPVQVGQNIGEVDFFKAWAGRLSQSARVVVRARMGDDDWHWTHTEKAGGQVTEYRIEDYLESCLKKGLGGCVILFRVELRRSHLSVPSPILTHIMFRYRVKPVESYTLKCDMDPAQNAALFDLNGGSADNWTNVQINVDPTVFGNYTSDDWMYEHERGLRWKIYQVDRKTQVGVLTSILLNATMVQEYENSIHEYPV